MSFPDRTETTDEIYKEYIPGDVVWFTRNQQSPPERATVIRKPTVLPLSMGRQTVRIWITGTENVFDAYFHQLQMLRHYFPEMND